MGKLHGEYIAGFVDGEGCFALKYRREVKYNLPGQPEYFSWDVEFAICLKADDCQILEKIRETLGCGKVGKPSKAGTVRYAVNDVKQLQTIIVPFFDKFKLQAKKRFDFDLWKSAVEIFSRGHSRSDHQRFYEIKIEMEKYKGGNRHKWKWLKEP